MSWETDRLEAEIRGRDAKIALLETEVSRLKEAAKTKKGRAKAKQCPCNSPGDHAGWCPRKEEA